MQLLILPTAALQTTVKASHYFQRNAMSKKTMSWVLTFTVMLMLMVVHRTRGDQVLLLRGGGGPARVLLSGDSPDVDYYYRTGVNLGGRVGLQNLLYPSSIPATNFIGAPTYGRRGRILSAPFVSGFYN